MIYVSVGRYNMLMLVFVQFTTNMMLNYICVHLYVNMTLCVCVTKSVHTQHMKPTKKLRKP